ncbi:MAG: tRNA pseudouridine(55) synthase TruB [Propionibacteriaceae bacterium]|nr:tRNA pseudouridine(55) synthase TruB [Propionibacteriaceae bacterium]
MSSGFVLVDKPGGPTSHDVVARLRRRLATRRVGHAGTLDPMATGLLVCAFGQATRLLSYLTAHDKTYEAMIRFGMMTSTDDAAGEVTTAGGADDFDPQALASAARRWTGEVDQIPATVSAIKVDGKRAHARVRAGETVELAPRRVRIDRIDLGEPVEQVVPGQGGDLNVVDVPVTVTCSAGTYIRALARDLGADLGLGAHLTALRRTASGPLNVAEADVVGEDLFDDGPVSTHTVASIISRFLPTRQISADEIVHVSHGRPLALEVTGTTALVDEAGSLLALYRPSAPGIATAERVFAAATSSKEQARSVGSTGDADDASHRPPIVDPEAESEGTAR